MDFFEHQERARKTSRRLVLLFFLGTLFIIGFVYLALSAYVYFHGGSENVLAMFELYWVEFLFLGGFILLVILGATLFQVSRLSKGGEAVAGILKAKPVSQNTDDPEEKKALNVLHEMSISSNMGTVPKLYLLENEPSINAFAAGWREDDAVVGLTRGAIKHLNRDELQAVVGHEVSHIKNGDMFLNIKMMGILFGLLVLTYLGGFILRNAMFGYMLGGRRSRGDPRAIIFILIIGLSIFLAGIVGMIYGNIVKAAVSRQREYLADASSVQFTRMPEAMSGALRKIKEMSQTENKNHLNNPNAEQASHLFFTEAVSKLESLFATHPPIEKRIERIEQGMPATQS